MCAQLYLQPSCFSFHTQRPSHGNVVLSTRAAAPWWNVAARCHSVCFRSSFAAFASAECLALCWTGGQLNVQEDAAPRNLNASCAERCWLCPGVCSCMVQARFNVQLSLGFGGSNFASARTCTFSFSALIRYCFPPVLCMNRRPAG